MSAAFLPAGDGLTCAPMSDSFAETHRFPNTGRFLMGRLRDAMTDSERALLESLVGETEWIDRPTRLIASGEECTRSTILIDGFILRTLDGEGGAAGRRHAVSFHVPGEFVDLHGFVLRRLDHNLDTVGRVKVG